MAVFVFSSVILQRPQGSPRLLHSTLHVSSRFFLHSASGAKSRVRTSLSLSKRSPQIFPVQICDRIITLSYRAISQPSGYRFPNLNFLLSTFLTEFCLKHTDFPPQDLTDESSFFIKRHRTFRLEYVYT